MCKINNVRYNKLRNNYKITTNDNGLRKNENVVQQKCQIRNTHRFQWSTALFWSMVLTKLH